MLPDRPASFFETEILFCKMLIFNALFERVVPLKETGVSFKRKHPFDTEKRLFPFKGTTGGFQPGYSMVGNSSCYLLFFTASCKINGSLVVMKSTLRSISHFISSASSMVHTLTFKPRSWASFIHSGCFFITPM